MSAALKQRASGLRDEEGVALILALVFVVLLAVIVTEFTYGTQVDATLIGNETSQTHAYVAARSALALSQSVLAADLIQGEDEANRNQTGMYDGMDEPWAKGTPVVEYNEAMVAIEIADEYGKINLNALIYEDQSGTEIEYAPLVEALRSVFQGVSADADPVDAILDWLDKDDVTRPNGFESDYYEKLEPPIVCKNGPMDSLEELLLIPGVSQEIYFAEPEVEPEEPIPPMGEILTVHGHPEGRVNINTAPVEVLEAIFEAASASGGLQGSAEQVMQRLEDTGPYTSRQELQSEGLLPAPRPDPQQEQNGEAPEIPPPAPELFDVRSSVFRIRGDSKIGDVSVRVEAYVWRDTPQDDTAGQQAGSGAKQIFRIIDWRLMS